MPKTWFTSDLHFCHDREFIWGDRGYNSVEEMNEEQIRKFNSIVSDEDTVYILGDVMLKDNIKGIQYLNQLKGDIIIVAGNHDSDARLDMYKMAGYPICYAERVKINGYHFYLSHFPTLTANFDDEKPLKQRTINICGHSHTTNPFSDWDKYHSPIFHCEVDTNNGYPWLIDNIIYKMKEKLGEV